MVEYETVVFDAWGCELKNGSVIAGIAFLISFLQLFLLALISGFFFAWASSAMWGLDLVPGAVAIEAMNGINTAVRNVAFAPAFFGPLPVGILSVILLYVSGETKSAFLVGLGLLTYFLGAFLITVSFSVPMNRELMTVDIPADPESAARIWQNYSTTWQFWNWVRTGFSALAFICTAIGLLSLKRR